MRAARRRECLKPAAQALLLWLLAGVAAQAAETSAPFAFTPPDFLRGPHIARALLGTTYAYTAAPGPAQLLITTIPAATLRAQVGGLSPLQCIRLFAQEIEAGHSGFFGVMMTRPLAVGTQELLRYRWHGDKGGRSLTGVLSCGELDGRFFVIHFVDELRAATRSFPAIRASLRALRVPHGASPTNQ